VIKPIEIFSSNPGKVIPTRELSVASIFNNAVIPSALKAQSQTPVEETEQEGFAYSKPGRQKVSNYRDPTDRRELSPFLRPPEEPNISSEVERMFSTATGNPSATQGGFDPADFVFNSEARRDSQGRLRVYQPPSGDGGGAYEIAGITTKYQPKEATKLRSLIDSGRTDEAESMAKEFYRKRASPFLSHTDNPGLQLQITDSVHHRGEGGLRRILQRATGSDSKSYAALIGELSQSPDPLGSFHEARQAYEWEEVDRGRASRKKFRQGLRNRFNKADAAARQLLR